MAAGLIIAREAGAMVGGIHDGQSPLETGIVLVANDALYAPFRKAIQGD